MRDERERDGCATRSGGRGHRWATPVAPMSTTMPGHSRGPGSDGDETQVIPAVTDEPPPPPGRAPHRTDLPVPADATMRLTRIGSPPVPPSAQPPTVPPPGYPPPAAPPPGYPPPVGAPPVHPGASAPPVT